MNRLTKAQIDEAKNLRLKGWSLSLLGTRYGISAGAMSKFLKNADAQWIDRRLSRKITEDQAAEIRKRYADTLATQKELASEYKVSVLTISNIVRGLSHTSIISSGNVREIDLTEAQKAEILERYKARHEIIILDLAAEYGLPAKQISSIIKRLRR